MNRRYFCKLAGLSGFALVYDRAVEAQTLPPVRPADLTALIELALAAHGGAALKNLKSLHEVSETRVSGPAGFRLPTRHYDVWLDRAGGYSRWQATVSDKAAAIFEQTPDGIFLWTKDLGTQKVKRDDPFLSLAPLGGSGIIGLFALQYTTDPLTLVENGEIQGKKGRMIVRAQPAPVENVLESGREGLQRVLSQTTWSYLFAPDGTLIAEENVETQPQRVAKTTLSFDEFRTFGGIKYPTEVGVKSSLAPKGISIHSSVTQVTVDEAITPAVFQLPAKAAVEPVATQ